MQVKLLVFLCGFLLLLKIFAIYTTGLDLFGDEAQYWVWSKNLDYGYYSKPPLIAWVISLVSFVFGDDFENLKFIPIITYCISSYVVFLIYIKLFHDKKEALIAGLTFFLLPAVSFSSFIISTDVLLILMWSLSILYVLKIRENPSFINFVILGVFLGLAFLAKYAAIYFLLSLILLVIFDEKIRQIVKKKMFYIFVFLFTVLIILSPNILWNIDMGWVTFIHTSDNAALDRIRLNLFGGFKFLFAQIIMIGPILFLSFIFKIRKTNINFSFNFLLIFSMPILLIVLIESIIVRANANWASVALISFFLLLFKVVSENFKKAIIWNNFFNFLLGIFLFFFLSQSYNFSFADRINGISQFVTTVEKNHLRENKNIVIGDRLLISNFEYLLRDKKYKIFTPYKPNTKIVSHFQISQPLAPSMQENFIFIGSPLQIKYLNNDFKLLKIKSKKVLFKKQPITIYEVIF